MRKLVAIVAVLLMSPRLLAAGDWQEEANIFVMLPQVSNEVVASAVESALAPLQFKRDKKSLTQHPTNLLRDLVAHYEAGTYALASVFRATAKQCFYISVDNYSKEHAGLSAKARVAVEQNLRASFGENIAFFSDMNCKNAT